MDLYLGNMNTNKIQAKNILTLFFPMKVYDTGCYKIKNALPLVSVWPWVC